MIPDGVIAAIGIGAFLYNQFGLWKSQNNWTYRTAGVVSLLSVVLLFIPPKETPQQTILKEAERMEGLANAIRAANRKR